MTPYELELYHKELGIRVLTHRYRYYVLDMPVLEDWIYDYLERQYEALSITLNKTPVTQDLVGFKPDDPHCLIAKNLVDQDQDYYSIWLSSMKPVWERLGPPRDRKHLDD